MERFSIKSESLHKRCDICHQSDLFDPQTGHCSRCCGVGDGSTPTHSVIKAQTHFISPRFAKRKETGAKFGAICGIVTVVIWFINVSVTSNLLYNKHPHCENETIIIYFPSYTGIAGIITKVIDDLSHNPIYATSHHTELHNTRVIMVLILSLILVGGLGAMFGAFTGKIARRLGRLISTKLRWNAPKLIIWATRAGLVGVIVLALIGAMGIPAAIFAWLIGGIAVAVSVLTEIGN